MKEYYLDRLHWIFSYTSKNFWYCLGKTLCLVIGVPIYAVAFALEMLFTFVNMLFSWIPVLNVVVMVFCKILVWLFGSLFYLCILTDIRQYLLLHKTVPDDDDDKDGETEAVQLDENQQQLSPAETNDDAEPSDNSATTSD